MTTLEVSNLGRYGYMGGRGGSSMSSQTSFMEARARASPSSVVAQDEEGSNQADNTDEQQDGRSSPIPTHRHNHSFTQALRGGGNWLLSIVGLDLYTKGKGGEGLKKASRSGNPFDQGVVINCEDFWTRGRALGVKYEELYDVPPGGFAPHSQLKRAGQQSRTWLGETLGVRMVDEAGQSLSSSGHGHFDDDDGGAGAHTHHSRRWNMWTSVKRSLPRMTNARGDYALVQADHQSREMA